MPEAGDLALACMRVLVDALVRGGMTDACIAPGSRSAPIALALERDDRVRLHVHLDERSMGFFALGLAKASRRPVAVACTSGTAVVNLHPAMVEASASRVPLIALTADRPPELRGTGANQTIDQVEVFGTSPRLAVDAEVPREGAGAWWRALGSRVLDAALGVPAGPVHVNLPFREPLVPTGAPVDLGPEAPAGEAPRLASLCHADVDLIAARIAATERGVVYAGTYDARDHAVADLARAAGWPLIAEPTSGLRIPGALTAGVAVLADVDFVAAHRPDLVLLVGANPTSRAAQAWLADAASVLVLDAAPREPTPGVAVDRIVVADVEPFARAVAGRFEGRAGGDWLAAWHERDAAARAAADTFLDGDDAPFEPRIARDVAAWLPEGAVLVVASSMPVRDLDAWMAPRPGVRVLGNRGASGIDGFVSTVLGVATGAPDPTVGVCGDLSFLHDVAGVVGASGRDADAILVVVNNGGGGIFDLLAQAGLPEHERLFVTPHDADLGALCAAAGVGHRVVETMGDLPDALAASSSAGGLQVIEIPIEREAALQRRRGLAAAITAERTD